MIRIGIDDALDRLNTWGRTYFDEQEETLYSNYTCGAFEISFSGRSMAAEFAAIPDTLAGPGFRQDALQREDWPFISVFLDDSDVPYRRIRVRDGEKVALFSAGKTELHRIRVVKLTENFRTCLGIRAFEMDGELLPLKTEKRDVMEMIGDSITCGFGNDTSDVSHEFEASEEDGWMTHGAIAARRLGLIPRFVSVSGISVENVISMPGLYCMRELYPFADRIIQDRLAQRRGETVKTYRPFDFAGEPARYVVLNLGTNDANQIYFREDKEQAELDFERNYEGFVSEVRRLNGPETVIICALGCMDYYLYDKIEKIVEKLRRMTGDERLFTLKYNKMMNIGPDAGGCLHPSVHRHRLMAEDLVRMIRTLQEKGL